jgi:hypothetical protein
MKNLLFFFLVAVGIKLVAFLFGHLKLWPWFLQNYQKYWYFQSGYVVAMTVCFCVVIYALYKALGINKKKIDSASEGLA